MTTTPTPVTPAAAPVTRGKVVVGGKVYYWGTGRRKKSVARVRMTAGEAVGSASAVAAKPWRQAF